MKKFSNIVENNKKEEKIITIDKIVSNLIDENIIIKGEDNLNGKENLIEKFKNLINENIKNKNLALNESKKYLTNIEHVKINEKISLLSTKIEELNVVPTVYDIFSSSDFSKNENSYVFEKLNSIPSEKYNLYLNDNEINNYFDNGHKLIITENNGWKLEFEPNYDKYYGDKDDNYKKFIFENKNFISNFIKSSIELIGNKNIIIDSRILNF